MTLKKTVDEVLDDTDFDDDERQSSIDVTADAIVTKVVDDDADLSAVERKVHRDYSKNSLFIELIRMPLNANLIVNTGDANSHSHCVWGISASNDGDILIITTPMIASLMHDGEEMRQYDVSCAISKLIDCYSVGGIKAVLPDGSVATLSGMVSTPDDGDTAILS